MDPGGREMRLKPETQNGSFQEECSAALLNCAREGSATKWDETRHKLLHKQDRVIIADLDISWGDLKNFNFARCYIIRSEFRNANLTRASFYKAIIKHCDFSGADITAADFRDAQVEDVNFNGVKFDPKTTKLNFINGFAEKNRARPALIKTIEEHQYLADLKKAHTHAWAKLWNLSTDYGTSLGRLSLAVVALNILFAAFYYLLERTDPSLFKPDGPKTFVNMVVLSLQKFLNTGATIDTDNVVLGFIFLMNTSLGFAVLGIFTALLSKKLIATLK